MAGDSGLHEFGNALVVLRIVSHALKLQASLSRFSRIPTRLGHIARGLLLKTGIFPLSRPELAEQVRGLGYRHLADLHERLRKADTPSSNDISAGLLYSKKLLVHLDRVTYSKIAQDQTKIARAKELKRAELQRSVNDAAL